MQTETLDFQSVESNLRQSFRVLASHRKAGEVRDIAGVTIAAAGVTFQMFNAAFLSAPVQSPDDLEKRIVQAEIHFGRRGQDWAYWVCEGWLDEKIRRRARQRFERHGLRLSSQLPGMVAERLRPPVRPLPPIEIRRVHDELTRDAFCNIGSSCFNVPLSWFREVFESESVWRDFAGYVGYVEGEAVTTAATVVSEDVVGVYNVATLPGRRRRGYGEAIVRHALERVRGERGLERTVLQSTPSGFPLYWRMGYRTVTAVAVYSS